MPMLQAETGAASGGGVIRGLVAVERGSRIAPANPLAAELARLRQDNASLTLRLVRGDAIIGIQKSGNPDENGAPER